MRAILDMTNLRDMIDNDYVVERTLIAAFHECYAVSLHELGQSLRDNSHAQWRNAAHAMKGIAFNIGAYRLGDACLIAEHSCNQPPAKKHELLKAITHHYAALCQTLGSQT
jgi:HPt (histidine-containing phosphotransfer) domain-containing protein